MEIGGERRKRKGEKLMHASVEQQAVLAAVNVNIVIMLGAWPR